VENRPFVLLVLALVVLIAVAVWQFYSLAWGESATSLRRTGDAPGVATLPKEKGDYILPW
jgi:hypothetical protein